MCDFENIWFIFFNSCYKFHHKHFSIYFRYKRTDNKPCWHAVSFDFGFYFLKNITQYYNVQASRYKMLKCGKILSQKYDYM